MSHDGSFRLHFSTEADGTSRLLQWSEWMPRKPFRKISEEHAASYPHVAVEQDGIVVWRGSCPNPLEHPWVEVMPDLSAPAGSADSQFMWARLEAHQQWPVKAHVDVLAAEGGVAVVYGGYSEGPAGAFPPPDPLIELLRVPLPARPTPA